MPARLIGTVVEIGESGDLITDLTSEQISAVGHDPETKVIVDEEFETIGIFGKDHQQPEMTLVAILETGQTLRLSLISDSASMMLGVKKGAKVEIR